jgi:hypothetical protein
MGRNLKKEKTRNTARKQKKAGKIPTSPVKKVDFLLHLNRLQGTLLQQLRKEI